VIEKNKNIKTMGKNTVAKRSKKKQLNQKEINEMFEDDFFDRPHEHSYSKSYSRITSWDSRTAKYTDDIKAYKNDGRKCERARYLAKNTNRKFASQERKNKNRNWFNLKNEKWRTYRKDKMIGGKFERDYNESDSINSA
jgi:hypothetical protein